MKTKFGGLPGFKLNKLFLRILLSFLSLLLPISIIGAFFYVSSTKNMEKDFSEKISVNLHSSASTIGMYLRTVQETNTLFFNDNAIRTLLQPDRLYTLEERSRLSIVPQTIARIQSLLSDYVDRIFVFVDDERVYTNEGVEDFELFFGKTYPLDRYSTSRWAEMLRGERILEILEPAKAHVSPSKTIPTLPILTRNTVRGHDVVMVVTMSLQTMRSTLMNNAIFPTTEFLLLDSNGNFILSTSDRFSESEAMEAIAEHSAIKGQSYENVAIGGEDYLVSTVKDENYGWNYYSITPTREFTENAGQITKLIVAICIVLTVVGIAFSVVFTLNLYNPIKKIRDILLQSDESENGNGKLPDSKRIPNDEFDMIGRRINQIMENNSYFQNKLNALSDEYVDSALQHLLRGGYGGGSQEGKLCRLVEKHFKDADGVFVCSCVRFKFHDVFFTEIQDTERIGIQSKLKNVVWGLVGEHIPTYVVEYQHNVFACIVRLPKDEGLERLKKALRRLTETFRYDARYCVMNAGIGKPYEGVEQLGRSFGEALSVLGYQDSNQAFQVLDTAEHPTQQIVYSYSMTDENKIVNALKTGDKELLRRQLDEQIERNRLSGVSPDNLSLLLTELYNTGKRYLSEKGLQLFQMITEEEDGVLRGSGNYTIEFERRRECLAAFYERIVDQTGIPKEKGSGMLITMIMEYIENNYHHDLYLEKIAEEMGTSAKYLSKVFKEKTKMNLTDYISYNRIARSKTLLLETDMSINEISGKVGIYSRTTFLRLFKKYEGISPSQYRESGIQQSTFAELTVES
ncbi:helix-turn-helix domain-containing protein [Cohnella herbarum]|uniref:AraC family transcriptional regulator n=1 Tax=Cohnella herbarum TaxID=2728023 RepID=A0A7Z2VKB6_9BACL|nr:helix-turn-helix domain-containing protein [Cohnella herbarum]QJD84550.1 AraC family transcriptional regulator [Cohnella herbarum]